MFANKTDTTFVKAIIRALNLISTRRKENLTAEDQLKLRLAEKYLTDVASNQGHELEYVPGTGFRLKNEKSKSKPMLRRACKALISVLIFPLLLS